MQFAALPASISLIPAIGVDAILSQVDSAAAFGGLDCVLLHPDYLQDQGANSLLAALRERNQHVCAFGWTEVGAGEKWAGRLARASWTATWLLQVGAGT